MTRRSIASLLAITITLIGVACGDDDDSSTPTATAGVSPSPSRVVLGPADAVAVFGSPDVTEAALKLALDAEAPLKFFLAGSSRDPDSFDGAGLPAESFVRGVALELFGAAEFDDAYEQRFGRSPDNFAGAREGYDAVYLVALAAAAADSTEAAAVRDSLLYVANSPGEIVNPGGEAFAGAVGSLTAGADVNYIGVSGQADFSADGESAKGRVSVWRLLGEQIVDQEVRDVDLAAEIGADVPAGEIALGAGELAPPLRIGAILPLETEGGIAVQDAMQLAADEINDAGGLFGSPIELVFADEADPTAAAAELEAAGVSAIIGPLSADAAQAVVGAVNVPQFVLTSSLAVRPVAGGNVFRGLSSDALQAPPLANLALEDGVQTMCVIHEAGAEYEALANAFKDAFEHKGGGVRALVELSADGALEGDLEACLGA
jgi:ABC-type branched-subunit amino acid transport system substrate-binding protein